MAAEPPRWTDDQLEADRQEAIETFRKERLEEPLEQYLDALDDYRDVIDNLLETTVDLTQLEDAAVELLTDPDSKTAVRYLAGPPISEDDLLTVSEAESLAPSRLRADPEMARRLMATVMAALDRRRFPWIAEGREPEPAEREAAALASAALMAYRRVLTTRAHSAKTAQEQAVEDRLIESGFEKLPTPRIIATLAAAPGRGQFCRETRFGRFDKADIVIGLWDDRKMPVECKVSNSSLNSIKRLNKDAAVKAVRWREQFGTEGVVPAAVLAGVFGLSSLQDAQEAGLTLFWAHNLEAMSEWIEQTRSS